MPPSSTFARASRPLFSSTSAAFQTRQAFQRASPFRQAYRRQEWSRRWQSTAAEGAQAGWFKRMWDSPIGFKTVHFWAPVMKVRTSLPTQVLSFPPNHLRSHVYETREKAPRGGGGKPKDTPMMKQCLYADKP